ncbi:MbnP family protein [Parasediminibacterium paludis]|uniref:MbnP family protein n=1 Tax=Parasediminibacterium paludis TaxID=908966 RepID=A0ABV8PW57_9BACT
MIKLLIIGFIVIRCCINTASFAQQTITLQFRNTIGNELLQLGNTYKNSFGEDLVINRFKYYVSNIRLINASGKFIDTHNDYYLIDEADSTSKNITFTTLAKQITGIEFLLGVDSIKNVNGVQTGALDPLNGMFWTWNSGYIMAKLEGIATVAKVPGNLFSLHVGGFRNGENTARRIRLEILNFKFQISNSVVIEADINKWFQSVHNIKIAEHPICHSPGNLAMQLADNYATMFKIVSVN